MLFPEIEQTQAIKVFYCYAREDKALRDELDKQLAPLKRLGLLATWHDREIIPGREWKREVDTRLNVADIVLLLISVHFMHSDYCYGVEMRRALERHKAGEAQVIPVILRPVEWKETPLGDLQALPPEGKPITKWRHRDEAFQTVAQGIRNVIESLRKESREPLFSSYTHTDAHIIQPRERTVEEVYAKLTQSNITALALTGIAGIGKSTLADLIANYKVAQYYLQKAILCPPREKRQKVSDIQPFIEATWHLCQAKRWQEAYTLMEQEDLFTELHHKGGNTILLELYQLMQPLEKWNQEYSPAPRHIYSSLGQVYQALGQPRQARECFERLHLACANAADRSGQGEALRHLALVYDY